jgi:hypothetical protein
MEEWIKKMWCAYTVEFYFAIKKREIMLFAGKWMELEIILFSFLWHWSLNSGPHIGWIGTLTV